MVNHGWHTGIAVRRRDLLAVIPELVRDFPDGAYLELGWGDDGFYRADRAGLGLALRAILWPTASVLHVVALPSAPQDYYPDGEVVALTVPRAGYEKLLTFMGKSFQRPTGKEPERLGRGLYGKSRFFGAMGNFHAFNTCNTWVARSIKETGFPMASATITAGGVMAQLRSGEKPTLPCYSVGWKE